jgi:hypothetical protein
MNYSFAAIAVRIFLLNHGGPITRLALLDDRGTITITIMIVRLADRHTSSDRSYANTNIICKAGIATMPITAATNNDFLMFHPPEIFQRRENARLIHLFRRSIDPSAELFSPANGQGRRVRTFSFFRQVKSRSRHFWQVHDFTDRLINTCKLQRCSRKPASSSENGGDAQG